MSKKISFIKKSAEKLGLPIVFFGESSGARMPDIMGAKGMSQAGQDNTQYIRTRNLKYIDITIMFLCCFIFARTFSIIFNGLSYSLFIPVALIPEYVALPVLIYVRKKML